MSVGTKRLVKLSKRLSWLLRHGARKEGLAMDLAGWVAVDEVLATTRVSRADLLEVVRRNDKSRLQMDGGRIRATQGHSRAGTPVTLEALEASWARYQGDDSVWHGTFLNAIEGIARDGLLPGERTHVHLADSLSSRVGKRHGAQVLLEVSVEKVRASGREVFVSQNGVILVRDVPVACIVGVTARSPKAEREVERIRETFGLVAVVPAGEPRK